MRLSGALSILLACGLARADDLIVKTESGLVKGFPVRTKGSTNEYYAFTGIPYAKPPVGPLRFQVAEPAEAWEGVYEANKELPQCWNFEVYNAYTCNVTKGSEDCLYLSVYTPQVSRDAKLPVMMFIHGGGWRTELPPVGSYTRAKYLVDQGVVLVIFHYRLGALGFLSMEDDVLPGNLGLKDQVRALTWIRDNIDNFGGDPNRITVFGNSVGGASVQYLLTSPLSKDMLQGGVSQSGYSTALWAFGIPGVAKERAQMLARDLSCPSTPTEDFVKCLRGKSAEDITNAERNYVKNGFDPPIWYQPTIEKGKGAFLRQSPYTVNVKKPWIVGITSGEGSFRVLYYKAVNALKEAHQRNGAEILPDSFMFTNTSSKVDEISQAINKRYLAGPDFDINIRDMYTDGFFLWASRQALLLGKGPTYFYFFEHSGKKTFNYLYAKEIGADYGDLGAPHTEELQYLFNYEDEIEDLKSEADRDVVRRVVKLWTDFAKTGKPTSDNSWPEYGKERKYLELSTSGNTVKTDLWKDRADFWDSLPLRDLVTDSKPYHTDL